MTIPRVHAITAYWARTPPLAESFAAFAGITPAEATPTKDFEDFLRDMGVVTP